MNLSCRSARNRRSRWRLLRDRPQLGRGRHRPSPCRAHHFWRCAIFCKGAVGPCHEWRRGRRGRWHGRSPGTAASDPADAEQCQGGSPPSADHPDLAESRFRAHRFHHVSPLQCQTGSPNAVLGGLSCSRQSGDQLGTAGTLRRPASAQRHPNADSLSRGLPTIFATVSRHRHLFDVQKADDHWSKRPVRLGLSSRRFCHQGSAAGVPLDPYPAAAARVYF